MMSVTHGMLRLLFYISECGERDDPIRCAWDRSAGEISCLRVTGIRPMGHVMLFAFLYSEYEIRVEIYVKKYVDVLLWASMRVGR